VKLAYVTPRYGENIIGGAEHAVRMLSERLVAHTDIEVEVFTTCADDIITWKNTSPPGSHTLHGVRVHRFASLSGRAKTFPAFSETLLSKPTRIQTKEALAWIELQGPVTPDLVQAVEACDADLVAFYPYLYYPTVHGIPHVAERAIMHPAAHDEPPLRLSIFQKVFTAVQALVFQTENERRLVEQIFRVAHKPQLQLGLGVEQITGDEQAFRFQTGIGNRPYLLCLGRVDNTKGVKILSNCWKAFKQLHPENPHVLIFAGPIVHPLPSLPDVIVTGPIGTHAKWGALQGADVLISPSPFEAFSLVLLEAWSTGTPVLVNGHCGPTREHAIRSHAGLWFEDYRTFAAALNLLLCHPGLRCALGQNGEKYVQCFFQWDTIIAQYEKFLLEMAERVKSRSPTISSRVFSSTHASK